MRYALLASALLLSACASVPSMEYASMEHASGGDDSTQAVDDTRRLVSGHYRSPAWVNDAFTGTHERSLDGNRLSFSMTQTEKGGGWDAGVGPEADRSIAVADVSGSERVCFTYDLEFDGADGGKWWVGPKISVNWAAMMDPPGDGDWYENYVVEWANQTPAELEYDLFDFFDAELLGESEMAGATYRHIKLRFNDWWQYWSIRQDYRSEGSMAVRPILDAWTGLPQDLNFDGVKINIETHGPIRGSGRIIGDFADGSAPPNCK